MVNAPRWTGLSSGMLAEREGGSHVGAGDGPPPEGNVEFRACDQSGWTGRFLACSGMTVCHSGVFTVVRMRRICGNRDRDCRWGLSVALL